MYSLVLAVGDVYLSYVTITCVLGADVGQSSRPWVVCPNLLLGLSALPCWNYGVGCTFRMRREEWRTLWVHREMETSEIEII